MKLKSTSPIDSEKSMGPVLLCFKNQKINLLNTTVCIWNKW